MFGDPEDVAGQCNAWLILGDNYGDGHTTCRCQLPEGHDGPHEERFRTDEEGRDAYNCIIQWEGDDRHKEMWDRNQQEIFNDWNMKQFEAYEAAGSPDDFDWDDESAPLGDPISDDFDWRKS